MYLLKAVEEMGFDGYGEDYRTMILGVSNDTNILDSIVVDFRSQRNSFGNIVHDKTFEIYNQYGFESGHIPEHIREEVLSMVDLVISSFPLIVKFRSLLDFNPDFTTFIVEPVELLQ